MKDVDGRINYSQFDGTMESILNQFPHHYHREKEYAESVNNEWDIKWAPFLTNELPDLLTRASWECAQVPSDASQVITLQAWKELLNLAQKVNNLMESSVSSYLFEEAFRPTVNPLFSEIREKFGETREMQTVLMLRAPQAENEFREYILPHAEAFLDKFNMALNAHQQFSPEERKELAEFVQYVLLLCIYDLKKKSKA